MRDEFIIQRQGKDYVLFAGLLDEAHAQGLRGITTEMLQSPFAPDSDGVAIVRAVVAMPPSENDPEGKPRSFSGIGDASATAKGAGPAEKQAPLRMAETRAKARALRDAVNVGATAFEELGMEDDTSTPSKSPQRSQTGTKAPQRASQGNASSNVEQLRGGANKTKNDSKKPKNAAQKSQKDLIRALLLQWQQDSGRANAYLGKILENLEVDSLDHITKPQAEEIIEWVNSKLPDEDDEPEDEVVDFDEDEVEEG